MSITPKHRTSVLILAAAAGAIFLIQIFHAWLQPSIALALLDGLFLCQ